MKIKKENRHKKGGLPPKLLISYCGICCSLCPLYKIKQCPGCPKLKECKIVQCGKSKGIRYCFQCKKFPCKIFEEGFDWDLSKVPEFKKLKLGKIKFKPYSKEYVKVFKVLSNLWKRKT